MAPAEFNADLKAKQAFVGELGFQATFDLFPDRDDFFAVQTWAAAYDRPRCPRTAAVLGDALTAAGFGLLPGRGFRSSTGESRVYRHADGREFTVSVPKQKKFNHVCVS